MTSCLISFPTEITKMVCDHLDTRDLASFVGASRNLYLRFLHLLAERYEEYHIDFSKKSLNHLHAIANNDLMRQYVNKLVVLSPDPMLGNGLDWRMTAVGHLNKPLHVPHIQRLRDDLVEKLVNCRSFVVSPIRKQFMNREQEAQNDLYPDDIVYMFLEIIADASLPVEMFWYGRGMNYDAQMMMPEHLHKSIHRHPGFITAWAGLENLHLHHDVTISNYSFYLDLILSARNLRKLHLSAGNKNICPDFLHDVITSDEFSTKLEKVTLEDSRINTEDLATLVFKSRYSLRQLSLDNVSGVNADFFTFMFEMQHCFPELDTIYLREVTDIDQNLIRFNKICEKYPVERKMIYLEKERISSADYMSDFNSLSPDALVELYYSGPCIGRVWKILDDVVSSP